MNPSIHRFASEDLAEAVRFYKSGTPPVLTSNATVGIEVQRAQQAGLSRRSPSLRQYRAAGRWQSGLPHQHRGDVQPADLAAPAQRHIHPGHTRHESLGRFDGLGVVWGLEARYTSGYPVRPLLHCFKPGAL